MAQNQNRRRPTFVYAPPPVQPSKDHLTTIAAAFGGVGRLVTFITKFITRREELTGWRVINDVASRDRFAQSEAGKREELETPMPPLTSVIGEVVGQAGGDAVSREAIIQALAALANEPEAQKAGLSIRPSQNLNVTPPYASVSIASRTMGLNSDQRDLLQDLLAGVGA